MPLIRTKIPRLSSTMVPWYDGISSHEPQPNLHLDSLSSETMAEVLKERNRLFKIIKNWMTEYACGLFEQVSRKVLFNESLRVLSILGLACLKNKISLFNVQIFTSIFV